MKPEWNKDKPILTKAYFEAMNECTSRLIELIDKHNSTLVKAIPLIGYVIDRMDAVLVLTQNGLFWDADIIVRSALETLVKFGLIADAEEADRPQLFQEFWFDLSEIYKVKISEQNKKNLTRTEGSDIHYLAYAPLVLTQEEENTLRLKWPKATRTRLEQKWSFTGIVNTLSKNNVGTPMEKIDFLTHTYRMSSHIAHGDEMGINLITERRSRPKQEKEDVEIGHYLRLMSDCFSYTYAVAYYTCKYVKADFAVFRELFDKLEQLNGITNAYHMVPFEDKIYDNYRK